ncbi:MAG: short-chain dehydrogenase [Acidobacteria bacterium]|nr:MAG: short-chain dehydrogenase [Acidobacteriota bacterium]
MRLKGKVAVVTGAGAGMGQAVALRFAREGARVVVAEVNTVSGKSAVEAIQRAQGESIFVHADVSEEKEVQLMIAATLNQYGRVDILYNNAAVELHGQDARAHELSAETWDRTHAINLRSVWLCSKYAIPPMLEHHGGSIIHVASPTGLYGCAPGYTAYSASKGGVVALTRVMAADYARDNIRVNAIVPGTTDTPMIAPLLEDEGVRARLMALSPMGRLGRPDDVAGLAVFLASDESAYCTGGIYMADGGLTAI